MEKEQLIKQIKHAALLRFELFADDNHLKGQARSAYINRQMQPVIRDAKSQDTDGLKSLLQHQQFMLRNVMDRRSRVSSTTKYSVNNAHSVIERKCNFKFL